MSTAKDGFITDLQSQSAPVDPQFKMCACISLNYYRGEIQEHTDSTACVVRHSPFKCNDVLTLLKSSGSPRSARPVKVLIGKHANIQVQQVNLQNKQHKAYGSTEVKFEVGSVGTDIRKLKFWRDSCIVTWLFLINTEVQSQSKLIHWALASSYGGSSWGLLHWFCSKKKNRAQGHAF